MTITGVAVLTGDTFVIRTHPNGKESHRDIREYYNIKDDNRMGLRQSPIEYHPGRSLDSCQDWMFVFDDKRPDWWTDNMTEKAERVLWQVYRARWDGNKYSGDLILRDCTGLTSLPENLTCGDLDLRYCTGLTALPENLTCGDLELYGCTGLTALPENLTCGDLDLSGCTGLTALPENLTCGNLYLYGSSITSLGNATVKGTVYKN